MIEWLLFAYGICVGCCLCNLLDDVLSAYKGELYLTWGGLVRKMFLCFIPVINLFGLTAILSNIFYKVVDLLDKPLFKR